MKYPLIIPKTSCIKPPEMFQGEKMVSTIQVLLGWGSSALMQEDVALTEAACPLSKSNYDNHASGKAVARRTARHALIQQAAYLNHSSPPLQTPSSANVDGLLKRNISPLQPPVGSSVMTCSCLALLHVICFPCHFSSSKVSDCASVLRQTCEWFLFMAF